MKELAASINLQMVGVAQALGMSHDQAMERVTVRELCLYLITISQMQEGISGNAAAERHSDTP